VSDRNEAIRVGRTCRVELGAGPLRREVRAVYLGLCTRSGEAWAKVRLLEGGGGRRAGEVLTRPAGAVTFGGGEGD
jgi:hypothetical protein